MARAIRTAAALLILACAAGPVLAQDWPTRPVRVIVGFGPGGGTDIVSRIVAQHLSEVLGQPVVVENKPGGGGITGAETVAKSPKDGYTAFMQNNGHAITAVMYKSLPFDAVKDFAPVGLVATSALIVAARPDLPAKDMKDLVAMAKANPGQIKFASVGLGSTQHFAGELLKQTAGIDLKHIPYRGTPAAIQAVRSKEVDLVIELVQPLIGQIRSGDLRALAMTSPTRYPAMPDLVTAAESGVPGYDVTSWYGLVFPAGTSPAIIEKTNKALRDVLAREGVRKQIQDTGAIAQASSPADYGKHVEAEIAKWKAVREKAGIEQQ
jgi:tripartite-type tricarboxylate transporter receptor subunit TctC